MEDNTKTQNQTIVIIGLIALIFALFIGVKLIFAGLDAAIDSEDTLPAASQSTQVDVPDQSAASSTPTGGEQSDLPAPSFCPHCGDGLPESFDWGQFCPWCGEKVE